MSINIFKKSAIGLMVLGLASASYAGSLWGPVNGLFLGGEGLDLQPRNGDTDFVTVNPIVANGTYNIYNVKPNYGWGWRLFGGIAFCGNEDFTVGYERFHTSEHNFLGTPVSPEGSPFPGSSNVRWLFTTVWENINASVDFDLDDAFAEFGHTVKMGPWSLRYAGGVEWTRLDSDMTITANIPVEIEELDNLHGYNATSHMRGVGPRTEIGMSYHLPYGFAVFANANTALLISTRTITLETVNEDQFSFGYPKRHVVIPKFGMRLGAAYGYTFGGAGGEGAAGMVTTLAVTAGWQVESFVHAIERPYPSTTSSNSNTDTKVSNYANQGFFIGARVMMGWL